MEHLSPNISITSMVLNIPIKTQKLAGKHTIKLSNHMLSIKKFTSWAQDLLGQIISQSIFHWAAEGSASEVARLGHHYHFCARGLPAELIGPLQEKQRDELLGSCGAAQRLSHSPKQRCIYIKGIAGERYLKKDSSENPAKLPNKEKVCFKCSLDPESTKEA